MPSKMSIAEQHRRRHEADTSMAHGSRSTTIEPNKNGHRADYPWPQDSSGLVFWPKKKVKGNQFLCYHLPIGHHTFVPYRIIHGILFSTSPTCASADPACER